MTNDEIGAVMSYMGAAFPNRELDERQLAVWAEHLRRFDARDAQVAAQAVVETESWFPAVSTFVAATQAAARTRVLEEQDQRKAIGSADHVLSRDEQLENLARAKQLIGQVTKRVPR